MAVIISGSIYNRVSGELLGYILGAKLLRIGTNRKLPRHFIPCRICMPRQVNVYCN